MNNNEGSCSKKRKICVPQFFVDQSVALTMMMMFVLFISF